MKPTIFLTAALFVILASSCTKRHQQTLDIPGGIDSVHLTAESAKYTMAKPGNYWVYQTYKVYDNGKEQAMDIYDTVRVEKDTVINNRVYHKMLWPEFGGGKRVECIIDSADYMVTNTGKIIFSATDMGTVFKEHLFINAQIAPPPYDTIARVKQYMGDRDLTISVPVGRFTTTSFIERYDYRAPHSSPVKGRSYYYRYAKNVGPVSYTLAFYLAADHVYEARLVQYKVK